MRIFFLFILSFVLYPVEAQIIHASSAYNKVSTGGGFGYCVEYQAVYDAYSDVPGTDTANVLNTFVVNAKAHGWWAKGDAIYFLGAKNVTDAKINWADPGTNDCTDPESTNPTFTQWQGILGVGNTDYWSTNFNASSEGINYTQNSVTIATYNRTSLSVSNAYIIGATDDSPDLWTGVRPYFGAPASVRAQINDEYGGRYEPTVTGSQGMLVVTRTDATIEVTFNKVSQGSTSNASAGIANLNIFLLARNHEGNDADNINAELFFVFIGGFLTDGELNYMTDDVEIVADYLGKGVIP
jgi:hypothetical protein